MVEENPDRKISPAARSILDGLEQSGNEASVSASFRYTVEDLQQLGGGNLRLGARRVVIETIKRLGEGRLEDPVRPFQEELDTTEPTPFGVPHSSDHKN